MSPFISTPLRAHVNRIYSEYLEMPGMHLTCAQAQRLWGLESATCLAALNYLIEIKFLCRTAAGQYSRLTEGAFVLPPHRAIKATPGRKIAARIAV